MIEWLILVGCLLSVRLPCQADASSGCLFQEQEVPMKLFLSKLEVVGIIVAVSFSFSAQAAEKKHITYSAKTQQILSQTTVNPGDVPNHELVQHVRIDTSTSADPDWKDLEWLSYHQADSVAGNGTHRGYNTLHRKDGAESYWKYEGTHKTIVKEDGSWEVPFEGKTQLVGGTGKFQNIKGSGTYKGKITPKGVTWEGEAEVEY
jgi:hypothetical protein